MILLLQDRGKVGCFLFLTRRTWASTLAGMPRTAGKPRKKKKGEIQ